MTNITDYNNKKVLILGLGLNQGGVGSTKFFADAGAKVRVTDLKTAPELQSSIDQLKNYPDIEYVLGEHKYEDIDWADLIIKNPALKPNNPYIIYAKEHGKVVETDMGIFLQFAEPNQIIGVTGTKGKSTTASIIYQILKEACPERSRRVVFAGNIGKSVLDTIPFVRPDTLVILELSSFQLEAFKNHQVSPKWAIITNIFPDHLNYYGSMEKYIEAKKWITENQTKSDYLFLKKGDKVTNNLSFLKGLNGQINFFSAKNLPENFSPKLPGAHNLDNFAAAFKLAQTFEIPEKDILKIMENFEGVDYRLQLVKFWRGIKIYNDSAATNPGAAIQALQALPGSILICGGMNKNLDYTEFAEAINQYAKSVYFLEGDATETIKDVIAQQAEQQPRTDSGTGQQIVTTQVGRTMFVIARSSTLRSETFSLRLEENVMTKQSSKQRLPRSRVQRGSLAMTVEKIKGTYNNFDALLKDVKKETKPGDIVLFSPGATSFNLFQNEFDRGRKFNQAVENIFK